MAMVTITVRVSKVVADHDRECVSTGAAGAKGDVPKICGFVHPC